MKTNVALASVIRFGLVAAIAGLLGACAPSLQDSQWTGVEAPKQNKVVYLRQSHDVRFEAGKDVLSPAEKQGLVTFLAREEVGQSDEISLASGGSAADQGLSVRRAAAVAGFLHGLNLKPGFDTAATVPLDHVTISVGRYIVIPPNCPDWRKPSNDDPANSPSSNFGCATATNLGLMVADPRDLISGKPPLASDAEYNALAVRRYREGTIKGPHDIYEKGADGFLGGTGIQEKK